MTAQRLTRRELSFLLYIATYQQRYGYTPTVYELAFAHRLGMKAASGTVRSLLDGGYLRHRAHTPRSLALTGKVAP